MTTVDFTHSHLRTAPKTRVFDVDDYGGFDPDLHGTHSPPASRRGVILFWAAVAALIAARVVLFDPSATRAVGSFPDQIAPTFQQR